MFFYNYGLQIEEDRATATYNNVAYIRCPSFSTRSVGVYPVFSASATP